MDQRLDQCEEHTFLFGAKKIRCYGSIDDLNSPSTSSSSTPKICRIVVHKVQSNDTLQSLELRYFTFFSKSLLDDTCMQHVAKVL
jgi:hypothetical protein